VTDVHGVAERAARESYGKLLAYLVARCGDVAAAEDALADAFASALERWPVDGIPRSPQAWLLTAARRRFLDHVRREERTQRLHERLTPAAHDAQRAIDTAEDIGDERLALMFACANPAIAAEMRAPLMLQAILGLDAARIASAFLIAPATMSQRLVRAKHKIGVARIPLRVPSREDLPERLDAVLTAIYTAFSGAWDDPAGSDPRTRGLASEALWLGRVVVDACPGEPEPLGLLALMLYAHSRRATRRDESGAFVPLDEQDPSHWDEQAIDEAEVLLKRALEWRRVGRFQLEAAIQSAHAARRERRTPDWTAIVALYDDLLRVTGSPVVALNRAAALAFERGPQAGLDALVDVEADVRMLSYQPYWATRADLLAKTGDAHSAQAAYARAIGLTVDPSIRKYLASKSGATATR